MKTLKDNQELQEDIFWLDGWEGKASSGVYVRNPLFEFIKDCEKRGLKVVGIRKPKDWNMEVIVEENSK